MSDPQIPNAERMTEVAELWAKVGGSIRAFAPSTISPALFMDFIAALDAQSAERTRAEAVKMREAAAQQYEKLYEWICRGISEATYNAEEMSLGEKAWQTLSDSMYDGTLASFENPMRAIQIEGTSR